MEAVERVIERPEPLDYIVVETTGWPIPCTGGHDLPWLELRDQTLAAPGFDRITLIDAENFDDVVLDTEVGRAQVIYSDILLLNKCDLASKERLEARGIDSKLSERNARILRSVKGDIWHCCSVRTVRIRQGEFRPPTMPSSWV